MLWHGAPHRPRRLALFACFGTALRTGRDVSRCSHALARRSAQAETFGAVRMLWHGAPHRPRRFALFACFGTALRTGRDVWRCSHALARRSAHAESISLMRLLWHGAARRRGSAPLPRL